MFARYQKTTRAALSSFQFVEVCSLFGSSAGFIPWLLRKQAATIKPDPHYKWHIDVESALNATEYQGSTLVIDLKPKDKGGNLSFYEVLDVWGLSYPEWTPILLHLSALFIDVGPDSIDRHNFTVADSDRDGPIYEFLYLNGGILKGKLEGRWTSPPLSATNGALLWPDALNYFFGCIKSRSPNVINGVGRK